MTITLRNMPPELEARLEERARASKASLTRTAIGLLEEALGLRRSLPAEHHDLDWLAGTWSGGEGDAFDQALGEQRTIEKDLWR